VVAWAMEDNDGDVVLVMVSHCHHSTPLVFDDELVARVDVERSLHFVVIDHGGSMVWHVHSERVTATTSCLHQSQQHQQPPHGCFDHADDDDRDEVY